MFMYCVGGADSTTPAPAPAEGGSEKQMIEKDAEVIPEAAMPASTMPLNMDRRFYILGGQPQFYGNFDFLQSPMNPVISLQPLQAIRARSAGGGIQAEAEPVVKAPQQNVVDIGQIPPLVPLEPGAALQFRSNILAPVQSLEIMPQQIPMVNNEPVPVVAARQLARFLAEARSQDGPAAQENMLSAEAPADAPAADSVSIEADKSSEQMMMPMANAMEMSARLEDESSVAQAKPSAIALAGDGGIASAAPAATALVGDGGLAISAPSATAIAGDFSDDDDKSKKASEMMPSE